LDLDAGEKALGVGHAPQSTARAGATAPGPRATARWHGIRLVMEYRGNPRCEEDHGSAACAVESWHGS
jgi:hypothetical protein